MVQTDPTLVHPPGYIPGPGPRALYGEGSVDRNTATKTQTLKWGREDRKASRKPKENDQQPQKPTETQGPCPDLRGFCIKALTISAQSDVCAKPLSRANPSLALRARRDGPSPGAPTEEESAHPKRTFA